MTPSPPRIKHNSDLAAQFMSEHKVSCRYPRVTEQIETIPLEKERLFPYGYNPSIVADQGGLYMAYRWHDGKTLRSSLAVAIIDIAGTVFHNSKIELGAGGEDPKLFIHNNHRHMSWVETTYPATPLKSFVQYADFEQDLLKGAIRPELLGNDGTTMQKNHVPWSQDGQIYWLYQTSTVQQVYRLKGNVPDQRFETPGPKWAYGAPRGGSPPVPYDGGLLRFFHSGLDNEFGAQPRRYFVGAYVMKAEPPFEVLHVSKRPIVYGSELDGLKKADREVCFHYKRQVVFPGGAVPFENGWLLAVGVNDSACELLKVHPENLNL